MTDLAPEPKTGGPGEQSVDPLWFKRAVFYEVLVRGFADSDGDGTGDIRGVTSKLDYLRWLGIDCIWLLPFYASRRCAMAATTSADFTCRSIPELRRPRGRRPGARSTPRTLATSG